MTRVDPHWLAGLRHMHDTLPVSECPFGPPSWLPDERPADGFVVCRGDACAPNTLIGDDGTCSGHVDRWETSGSSSR